MDKITILSSLAGEPLTKRIQWTGSAFSPPEFDTPYLYEAGTADVGNLETLSELLASLEGEPSRIVIRGALKEGFSSSNIPRRCSDASDPFKLADRQWLCVDIDELALPVELADFNTHAEAVALFAAEQLPDEFQGVDFHWQFSSSMGVAPGIKIHLWFWLSKPISDGQAKAWLSASKAKIDNSLYNPVHLHITSAPIFEPPEANPVKVRSGQVSFGHGLIEVPVPLDLNERVADLETKQRSRHRKVDNGNRLDDQRIVRNSDGLVIDGREQFLYLKSVDAAQVLTIGKALPRNIPSVEALAEKTWELFEAEADLSDGLWTPADAYVKARYRHRDLMKGWNPNGRFITNIFIPGAPPYFSLEPLSIAEGDRLLDRHLYEFFVSAGKGQITAKALRVTMGAGKTTRTLEHLKRLVAANPNLNVEIYLPRHDLIEEVIPQLNGIHLGVEVIHVRGRGDIDPAGNPPCRRYTYVASLEKAGLSVRPNACWRSQYDKCEFYDGCEYFQQFKGGPGKAGSIRLFPHAYLHIPRIETLPDPDIVIVDEAFLGDLHSETSIAGKDFRLLFRDTDRRNLGDLILNALRDNEPVLESLRAEGVTSQWLENLDFGADRNARMFDGRSNEPKEIDGREERRIRSAEILRAVLAEELSLADREQVSRLRYDPVKDVVILNKLVLPEIFQTASVLVLDATADQMVLEKLFPGIEFHRIDYEQRGIVTQVFDRTGSNRSWEEGEERIDDLVAVLKEHVAIGDRVLCISHKNLADELRKLELKGIAFEHFGALRGMDQYKDHEVVFITGRHQPPQFYFDGIARALWWDDVKPLQHDDAALFGAPAGTDLPVDLRGYLTTDPEDAGGVYVRSFSDPRIEALHQQTREAETVQAIARLRLVRAKRLKHIYLLSNLPIEMPVNRLISWSDLLPNRAEKALMEKGSIPLTPTGWLKMRPDLAPNANQAKDINRRCGVTEANNLFRASPLLVRLSTKRLHFRQVKNGKPYGVVHSHLFRPVFDADRSEEDRAEPGRVITANLPVEEWKQVLEKGYPDVPGSTGWGPIVVLGFDDLELPTGVFRYPDGEAEEDAPTAAKEG